MPGRGNRRFFHSIAAGAPFDDQQVSLDFDGSNEYMLNNSNNTLDIANAWSVGVWWKTNDITAQDTIFRSQPSGSANMLIALVLRGDQANDPINVSITGGVGETKSYSWNSLVSNNTWHFSLITWDGTTLKLYHDGVDQGAPDSTSGDTSVTMTNTARRIAFGTSLVVGGGGLAGGFDGQIHSGGLWSVVLADAEITALYNLGEGAAFNWGSNSGSYTSSASLQHWWRLGFDSGDIGADYGVSSTSIDVSVNAVNMDADDIVADYPGL